MARLQVRAFDNQLRAAGKLVQRNELVQAQSKVMRRCLFGDGNSRPGDLLVGPALPETIQRLETLIQTLEILIHPPPIELTLAVTTVGRGSVLVESNQAVYNPGNTIQLTALPGTNFVLAGWSGAFESTENPVSFTIADDTEVTATCSYENTSKDYHSGSIMLFGHKVDVIFGDITVTPLPGPVFDPFHRD